jgi:diketogulonate reductase-like aldo/keto reductase
VVKSPSWDLALGVLRQMKVSERATAGQQLGQQNGQAAAALCSIALPPFVRVAAVCADFFSGVSSLSSGLFLISATARFCSAENSVYEALRCGYRLLDCARIYGNEAEVGRGIRRALDEKIVTRDELFVVTKVWNDSHSRERALQSVKTSLKELQLDRLDLVLIHWPVNFEHEEGTVFPKDAQGKARNELDPSKASIQLCWQGLEDAVDQGLVRAIGVSNFSVQQIEALKSYARIQPDVNQVELQPYFQQEAMLEYAKKNGLVVMAYSPLGNLKREGAEDNTPLNEPLVAELAKKHNKSPAQIILRWGIQHGMVVLPKSVTPARIRENIDIFDFKLDEEDMNKMKELGKKNHRVSSFIHSRTQTGVFAVRVSQTRLHTTLLRMLTRPVNGRCSCSFAPVHQP